MLFCAPQSAAPSQQRFAKDAFAKFGMSCRHAKCNFCLQECANRWILPWQPKLFAQLGGSRLRSNSVRTPGQLNLHRCVPTSFSPRGRHAWTDSTIAKKTRGNESLRRSSPAVASRASRGTNHALIEFRVRCHWPGSYRPRFLFRGGRRARQLGRFLHRWPFRRRSQLRRYNVDRPGRCRCLRREI